MQRLLSKLFGPRPRHVGSPYRPTRAPRRLEVECLEDRLEEWTRTDLGTAADPTGYAARISHLRNGGGLNEKYLPNTRTVYNTTTWVYIELEFYRLKSICKDWYWLGPNDWAPLAVNPGSQVN
jgi:hypothetical protein